MGVASNAGSASSAEQVVGDRATWEHERQRTAVALTRRKLVPTWAGVAVAVGAVLFPIGRIIVGDPAIFPSDTFLVVGLGAIGLMALGRLPWRSTVRSAPAATLAALVLVSVAMVGCGSDDDTAAEDTSGPANTDAPATTGGEQSGMIEVNGADFRFENLPPEVKVGSKLSLTNSSDKELHEMVVVKLPDGETRSVDELIQLPEAEQEALTGSGPPAMVLLRPPGDAPQIDAVGDGTLTEPGRYIVLCSIPVGADPEAYLAAAQQSQGGPPPDVPGGPPHLVEGMYGEITVVE